ncbi:MAG: DUF3604 domain-containing protein [Myxococcota bacterium]|jgi:hypothetical protein|nr:DUF3604 domain-containing protein [Myxococcota bacterium]
MIRRLLLAILAILLLLLGFLFVAGKGWLGSDLGAGTPVATSRPASHHAATAAAQASSAADIGSHRAKQILFGDFHVHSGFSQDAFALSMPLSGGEGAYNVADACDFARYCSDLDFWSINDHAESSTPRRWRETIDAMRQCDAAGESNEPGASDLVSFLGWEWSHMGTTAENHFGHRNVIFRDLEDGAIPSRPIASDSPARYMQVPGTAALSAMVALTRDSRYFDYATYQQEMAATPRCPDGVPVRDLSDDCQEFAATPADLFRKLDDWGHASLVIPHGTTWGMYTPQGSNYAKQLTPEYHDPVRQRLVEIYSGHGNIEEYRGWREVLIDEEGSRHCPMPRDDFLPGCWQAGEIIRSRCLAAGESEAECETRAAETRQHYADADAGLGHLSVPGFRAWEWLDSAQCRDCFLPALSYRVGNSVQSMLALSREAEDVSPLRFRFGFIGSSDIHSSRPGAGYKEVHRNKMTDFRNAQIRIPGMSREEEPAPRGRVSDPTGVMPSDWLERDRAGSYFYSGGLVAVHAASRDRQAIWDGLESRETYATSGPRILLWFDLLNPPTGSGARPGAVAPMGSEVELVEAPIFQVRATGSRKQQPGCPDESAQALGPERLERLCGGECFFPSDERRVITRIEVVRIRPQQHPAQALDDLIEDPWRVFECEPDQAGCAVTFSDPEFVSGERDVTYYARAIEEPSEAINGGQLRCERNEAGNCIRIRPCEPWSSPDDACLGTIEERAWSSPIFVDYAAATRSGD